MSIEIIFKNGKWNNSNCSKDKLKKTNQTLYTTIDNFSPDSCEWKEKLYRYVFNITNTPVCICGEHCYFTKRHPRQYSVYCSNKCKSDGYCGTNNHFYGKFHTKETKEHLSGIRIGVSHWTDESLMRMAEHHVGDKNWMRHNTILQLWIERYGIGVATVMWRERNKKISKKNSGENNPMYGKPPTHGSGNGWSGWYRGIYFASIMELSFMTWCDDNKIIFEPISGKSDFSIEYWFLDKKRTYFPDFKLDTGTIIEIKPKSLIGIEQNVKKFATAVKIFDDFKVLCYDDFPKVKTEEIKQMYNDGILVFTSRYDIKFKEVYL